MRSGAQTIVYETNAVQIWVTAVHAPEQTRIAAEKLLPTPHGSESGSPKI